MDYEGMSPEDIKFYLAEKDRQELQKYGMSERQLLIEFTKAAMQGLCSNNYVMERFSGTEGYGGSPIPISISECALEIAQATLSELNKHKP